MHKMLFANRNNCYLFPYLNVFCFFVLLNFPFRVFNGNPCFVLQIGHPYLSPSFGSNVGAFPSVQPASTLHIWLVNVGCLTWPPCWKASAMKGCWNLVHVFFWVNGANHVTLSFSLFFFPVKAVCNFYLLVCVCFETMCF